MVWPPGFHSMAIKLSGILSHNLCSTSMIVILGCSIERKGFSSISTNDCTLIPNVWFTGFNGMMDI